MALTKVTGQVIKNTTDVTVGVLTVTNTLAVGGTVSIGGTLTYEDVTNVDAVGLITARNGIVVGSGITLSKDGDIFATGISTFSDDVNISGDVNITGNGDFNMSGGNGKLKIITSIGNLGILSSTTDNNTFDLFDDDTQTRFRTLDGRLHISADHRNEVADSEIRFMVDGTNWAAISSEGHFLFRNDTDTYLHRPDSNRLALVTGGTERFRIDNSGKVGINSSSPASNLDVVNSFVSKSWDQPSSVVTKLERNGHCRLALISSNSSVGQVDFGDNDDDNAGFIRYDHSDNSMAFRTNGGDKVHITSTGEVGIGTTNPAADLHVSSASNTEIRIGDTTTTPSYGRIIYNNDADSADALVLEVDGGNAISGSNIRFRADGDEKLRITSDGNLLVNHTTGRGVGNSNVRLLQVEGVGGESAITCVRNSNNTSGAGLMLGKSRSNSVGGNNIVISGDKLGVISFCGADGADLLSVGAQITGEVDGTPGSNDMPGRLVFRTTPDGSTTPSMAMAIDSNGLVGIGVTSTGAALHVSTTGQNSGIKLVDSSTSSGSPNLEIISKRQDSNGNTAFAANIYLGKNRTDQKVTSGIMLGTVNFGGNHTDGTEGNISYTAAIRCVASGDFNSKSDMPTDLVFCTGSSGKNRDGEAAGQSNVGTERVRIIQNGNVSIGSDSDSGRLYVKSSGNGSGANAFDVENSDGDELLRIRNDGGFYTGIDAGSPYNFTTGSAANVHIQSSGRMRRSTSSVRYKKDIQDATWGLAEVLKLKPVTYKSNGTGENADDKTYGGFTAEDIHDLGLTEFVEYNESNQPDSLNYGNMVALMAKAIQELNVRFAEELSVEVQKLSVENTALKERLARAGLW